MRAAITACSPGALATLGGGPEAVSPISADAPTGWPCRTIASSAPMPAPWYSVRRTTGSSPATDRRSCVWPRPGSSAASWCMCSPIGSIASVTMAAWPAPPERPTSHASVACPATGRLTKTPRNPPRPPRSPCAGHAPAAAALCASSKSSAVGKNPDLAHQPKNSPYDETPVLGAKTASAPALAPSRSKSQSAHQSRVKAYD